MIEFAEKNHVNPAWLIGFCCKNSRSITALMVRRLKFIQDLSERKTRIEWVRQFMRELEENAIANGKSGAFLRPICNIYNSFSRTSLHYPTLSPSHNSDLPFYYNNLIFIMDFGDDQNAFLAG